MSDATAADLADGTQTPHGDRAADALSAALRAAVRSGSANITTHLQEVVRDINIAGTRTRLHCYSLRLDGNGRVRVNPLADFLFHQIIDYAIPRRKIEEAIQQTTATHSAAAFSRLHTEARRLFTDLAQSGEAGELLLFAMAEAIFGLSQIICKMSLKTSPRMHYHGADGVYAETGPQGGLNIYWGESKVYADPLAAIRNCLRSIAPFLVQPEGQGAVRERDILLVNEFANFTDQRLVGLLRNFLDPDNPASLRTRHCGIALVAFDSTAYPATGAEGMADAIAAAIRTELADWQESVRGRLTEERLERFDIHFICVPMPSAEEFRRYFLSLIGV